MTIHIAICDDDSKDLQFVMDILTDIFVEHDDKCYLQCFQSAKDMLEKVNNLDIAILDISMEELNGLDLGRELKMIFPEVRVIYTTSYDQYCIRAINEIHAFSFLPKPLDRDDVKNQLDDLIGKIKKSEDKMEKVFYKVSDSKGKEYPFLRLELNKIIYFDA